MQLRTGRRPRGSALLWVLGFGFIVAMASLVVPPLLRRTTTAAFDVERQFEAQLLAANLREIAKYLVLYEKTVYTGQSTGAFTSAKDPATIDSDLTALWSQSFASADNTNGGLMSACGGYSVSNAYLGTHRINGNSVFCPFYFRSNLFTGLMAEKMLFEQWAFTNPVVRKGRSNEFPADGIYRLELDFTDTLEPAESRLVGLDPRMKLLREKDSRNLAATVTVLFFTDTSGFRAVASERFIEFRSRVTFTGEKGNQHFVEDTETVLMALSTPKDFALFFPYPLTGTLLENFSNRFPTTTEVFGRTYFNGDLDLGAGDVAAALDNLPTFHDAVILSGTFRPSVPGPRHLTALRQKFKKGIVVNHSAARYLLDGRCGGAADNTTKVLNQTQLKCELPPTDPECPNPTTLIADYIRPLNPRCGRGSLRVAGGTIVVTDPTPDACASTVDFSDCRGDSATDGEGVWNPALNGVNRGAMIHSGFQQVTVADSYAFMVSPTVGLTVSQNAAEIYGLVFGGRVDVTGRDVKFFSLSALQAGPGRAGIPDDATIADVNTKAAQAYQGTAVPLLNLPVIYSSQEGVR